MNTRQQRLEEDINRVLKELKDRKSPLRGHAKRRMWAFRFTVRFSYIIKRLFDIVFSILALILLSPLFVILAISFSFSPAKH